MKGKKILIELGKMAAAVGAVGGVTYLSHKEVNRQTAIRNRYQQYYQMTNQWLMNRNNQIKMEDYFVENKIQNIAVYGMGTLCELFYEEIKNSANINVKYFIDKDAEELYYGIDDLPVKNIDATKDDGVDAIIVTPIYDYEEIDSSLEEHGITAQRISLEDIVFYA